jgi:leader peptidase (prepilin peptidase)/N-methyltransferase
MVFLLVIFGFLVGSFLSAYTYRLPLGKSIRSGRSKCPNCKEIIVWYDNIPLLSFLLLKGKCRKCGRKISIRYPVIELTSAMGFVGIYYLLVACGSTSLLSSNLICSWQTTLGMLSLPFLLLVFMIVLMIFIIDLEKKIIPDELSLFGLVFVFLSLLLIDPSKLYIHLLAGFGAGVFLLLIHIMTSGKGMGLGDVKLALFLGSLLGWPWTVVWIFGAFLTGAIVGSILILIKKISFGKQVAFGPFLILSLVITLIWGEILLKMYLFY